jgi:hypothetical protein
MKKILIAATLALAAFSAQGREEFTKEYAFIGNFIDAGRGCERGDQESCVARDKLCEALTPELDRHLRDYIRNEDPFKSKNGAMNIDARYSRTKRGCQ